MSSTTAAPAGSKPQKASVRRAWQRVSTIADIVALAGYVVIAVSVIAGLILARTQEAACSARFADCSLIDKYPLLPLGVGVAFGGVLQGLLVVLIAYYVDARATDATA